jgi:hypothetical protein
MKIGYQKLINAAGTKEIGEDYLIDGTSKAWASVIVSGGTPTINDSLNTSSLTDDGVGSTDYNFTNNFTDANYNPVAAGGLGTNYLSMGLGVKATNQALVVSVNSSNSSEDNSTQSSGLSIMGDLA